MRVTGLDSVAMIDQNPVAVTALEPSLDDSSRLCSLDGLATRCGDVGTRVEWIDTGDWRIGTFAKGRAEAARYRERPAITRHCGDTGGGGLHLRDGLRLGLRFWSSSGGVAIPLDCDGRSRIDLQALGGPGNGRVLPRCGRRVRDHRVSRDGTTDGEEGNEGHSDRPDDVALHRRPHPDHG